MTKKKINKRNRDYWRERTIILEEATRKKSVEYYKKLTEEYDKSIIEVEKEIAVWYQRLADNNNISLEEAKKLLTANELKEFHWTVEEYIKYGEENALNKRWMRELENASARHHINRLEVIKIKTRHHVEALHAKQAEGTEKLLKDVYRDNYYRTAYDIQKGIGLGWSLAAVDENQLNKVLSKPWTIDERTFRDRCWVHKEELVNELHTRLTHMVMRGEAPDKTIKAVAERFGVSRSKAGRVVMTESAAMAAHARQETFRELGVEKYEVVATLDFKTSEICQSMDGMVFDVEDYQIGRTANPFHPNCRTTTAPYFDDGLDDPFATRVARGADGEVYHVPANMRYSDWKERLVDGSKALKNSAKSGIINIEIDKFVPCLEDTKTGAILETEVARITDKAYLKQFNEKSGWFVNWSKMPKDCEIYGLYLKGDEVLQGLAGVTDRPDWSAVYLDWAVAAPHNLGKNKRYEGVGGHLFTIGAELSVKKGYGGFMCGKAANEKLLLHYMKKFGAKPQRVEGHPYGLVVEEKEAVELLKKYNYEWR